MKKIDVRDISIVAQQSSTRFLIHYGNYQGSIFELESKTLTAPFSIDSILARGYWEEFTENINLEELLPNLMIESEAGGQLVPFTDQYEVIKGKINCVVFRQNDSDRDKLYQEILQGHLRQGWGYSEDFSLAQEKETFIKSYMRVTNATEITAEKQWNVLSRMLQIKDGDTIIIPKQPDHNHFLIVKAKKNKTIGSCYEFIEPLGDTNDYRHVIYIDQENIQVAHYDSLKTPLVIKRLLKTIAYSSPINFVRKRSFQDAVEEVYSFDDKNALAKAHPVETKLSEIGDQLYQEWVKTVRNLTPSDFEKLVKRFMEYNGFEIIKSNSYDRKGGDIDLLCSKEIQLDTPFEPKTLNLSYCIQIKKHTGYTDAVGVHQLIKMQESLNFEESNTIQKILISLADGFTQDCIDLAKENNVLLLDGVAFARLYFKSL